MKTKIIIGLLIGIVILGVAIFFSFMFPKSDLQERCEKGSWPPDCSFIEHLQGRQECEKCIELMGKEKFMLMIKEEMEIIELEPADLTQLTFMDDASDPDWSPDGSQIIFESGESDIYIINTDGTGLTEIGFGNNPSWSPVDNKIIYRHDMPCCSLVLADLDEGWENKVELASQIKEQGSWSPDGKKIAYSS